MFDCPVIDIASAFHDLINNRYQTVMDILRNRTGKPFFKKYFCEISDFSSVCQHGGVCVLMTCTEASHQGAIKMFGFTLEELRRVLLSCQDRTVVDHAVGLSVRQRPVSCWTELQPYSV